MDKNQLILFIWIAFTAIGLTAIVTVIVWAARNGQFGNQERARHMPLDSRIPPPDESARHSP